MSCPGNYSVHRPGDQFLPADQDSEHKRGKPLGQHLWGGHADFAIWGKADRRQLKTVEINFLNDA